MSRIAKYPVPLPEKVEVQLKAAGMPIVPHNPNHFCADWHVWPMHTIGVNTVLQTVTGTFHKPSV